MNSLCRRRFFLFLFWYSFAWVSMSAQEPDFLPLNTAFPDSSDIIHTAKSQHQAQISKIKKEKEMTALYEQRFDRFIGDLRRGNYVNDAELNAVFAELTRRITGSNPDLDQEESRLFISRDPWPNAAYIGDGRMVFNLGLLRRLENEAQAAFVICHEMAHWSLDHTGKAMEKYLERMNSKATQDRIKEIQKMEYGARKEAMALLQDIVFDSRRHSRTSEAQADSLGLVFMRRAGYDLREAISCLGILDACDEPKFNRELAFQRFFPHPDYPFKDAWLPSGAGFQYSEPESELDEDSLKTHPDCGRRIELLVAMLEANPQEKVSSTGMEPGRFKQLVAMADFDQVARLYDVGALGRCMHAADQMMMAYPETAWLHSTIAICFYRMYLARKDHTMGRYLERPSPRHDEDYGKLVKVLNTMRMSEMAQAGYHYAAFHLPKFRSNERFLAAYIVLGEVAGKEDPAALSEYQRLHPKGTWLAILQNMQN